MSDGRFVAPDFSELGNDGVREFFFQMQALVSFAQANMLAAAAEMSAREATGEDGAATLAQWVGITGRHSHAHAHVQARVAVS